MNAFFPMVVKTAYPFTLENNDPANNILGQDAALPGLTIDQQGQFDYLKKLEEKIAAGGGEGLIYWEPAWVSTECFTQWGWDHIGIMPRCLITIIKLQYGCNILLGTNSTIRHVNQQIMVMVHFLTHEIVVRLFSRLTIIILPFKTPSKFKKVKLYLQEKSTDMKFFFSTILIIILSGSQITAQYSTKQNSSKIELTGILIDKLVHSGEENHTTISQPADSVEIKKLKVNLGGALRFNYNYSSWKPLQKKVGGAFGFEVFRLNVDAEHGKWGIHIDQRFYAQGFGGAFLKYGWFQYQINEKSHVKLGLIPAYFGTQQFNSHSWFFQLPFYLGFEDDHDMGLSYNFENDKIQLDFGFYKNAETLSFANNAPISDARYNYDFSGRNKEINQSNLRFNYKLGTKSNSKIGASLQYGGIWNIDTEDVGSHYGLGLHYESDFKNWNVKAQFLTYDNRAKNAEGESRDWIEMTAYGAPYQTAAKASIYSISIAYTFVLKKGIFDSIQIYNDYSYMNKSISDWEDTQMNVFGLLLSANPMYIYVDFASGLHQPWLGPQWTGALSTGDPENSWENRFNINFGYYF